MYLKDFLKKVKFEKSQQTTTKAIKLNSIQRVKSVCLYFHMFVSGQQTEGG